MVVAKWRRVAFQFGAVRVAMFAMATGMMVLALFCLAPLMLTATSTAGVLDHDLLSAFPTYFLPVFVTELVDRVKRT